MLSKEAKELARAIATGVLLIQWNPNIILLPDAKKELEELEKIKEIGKDLDVDYIQYKTESKEPWRRGRPLK